MPHPHATTTAMPHINLLLSLPLLLLLLSPRSSSSSSVVVGRAPPPKRGLSGLEGCGDAAALGLADGWEYNWGLWPTQPDADGDNTPDGSQQCETPRAREFVPMFWGCGWARPIA